MGLISTTIALSFPFATICWWVYSFRHAKSPVSFVGSIVGVTAVAVSSLVPIAEIVFTRRILALRPSVWWTYVDRNFYLSSTAIFFYFFLLLLAIIYFCYELKRATRRTRTPSENGE